LEKNWGRGKDEKKQKDKELRNSRGGKGRKGGRLQKALGNKRYTKSYEGDE